ncbi:hypothetical protein [Mucilaginibacter sp.]|uniref:hypothetical protein n=1 Tax=Mucilaginibacter sp. TaxID=1882438 RepID=UPI0025DD72F6|nr:hypothetical protein [Mucilaginibacter sp.]
MKEKLTKKQVNFDSLITVKRYLAIGSIVFIGAVTSCSNSNKNQTSQAQVNSDTAQTSKSNELVITDNLALNTEYRANPEEFKSKYLHQYVTFNGFYYKKNPFNEKLSFLLKYPGTEKIGTDPIDVVELRFNTPKPKEALFSYFSSATDNKYWIYNGQDDKIIEQMNTHTSSDINEQPLAFYKPKLDEYIDEPSHETRGFLLGYNDNALRQVFTKYSQLFYKPTTEDDFDYNKIFILSTVTVKGKVDEINVGVDGSVWMKLSDEKILKVKDGFVKENMKLIDMGALKGIPNSTPDTTIH